MSLDRRPTRDELLALAVELAASAAEIHRAGRRTLLHVSEKSSPFNLVTQVDREAEEAIVEQLRRVRPADAVLGEEGGARAGTSGVRWIVDPLDGTANYVYGYPAYAVSIGVEVDGVLEVGVVHDTAHDILYTGTRDGTATMNGRPIRVTDQVDPATAMVATGFSFVPGLRGRQGLVLAELLPRIRDVRRGGAASLDMCAVAAGAVDVYYEGAVGLWDVAGGVVVARAAGAQVWIGELPGYSGVSVAGANPSLLRAMLPVLRMVGFPIDDVEEVVE